MFIDDVFLKFFNFVQNKLIVLDVQELHAAQSFYRLLIDDRQLTERQAMYAIKILKKYQTQSADAGFDFSELIESLAWKNPFRILDESKKIYVNSVGTQPRIVLKFPFSLKKTYEETFSRRPSFYLEHNWDGEEKLIYVSPYEINLTLLNDFVITHEFEIDESFRELIATFEEIANQEIEIVPHARLENNKLVLKNCTDSVVQYFEQHSADNLDHNLMLIKQMNIKLMDTILNNPLAKICNYKHNQFKTSNYDTVFDVIKRVPDKVCVFVSDDDTYDTWIKNFVYRANLQNIHNDEIVVCFREKHKESGFNKYLKEAGLGGKVDSGRIYIMKGKPPTWLFTNEIKVSIIVSNSLFPVPHRLAQSLFNSHPCAIVISDLTPTSYREQKIVDL